MLSDSEDEDLTGSLASTTALMLLGFHRSMSNIETSVTLTCNLLILSLNKLMYKYVFGVVLVTEQKSLPGLQKKEANIFKGAHASFSSVDFFTLYKVKYLKI